MNYENFYYNGQQFFAHNKYQFWFLIHKFCKAHREGKKKTLFKLKRFISLCSSTFNSWSGHNAKLTNYQFCKQRADATFVALNTKKCCYHDGAANRPRL